MLNNKKINKIDEQLEECRNGNHDLTIIFQESSLNDAEATVRWCKRCGSVVVDADRDDRTYPGRIMGMKGPQIYQPFRQVDEEVKKEKKRVNFYAVVETVDKGMETEFYRVVVKAPRHFLKPTDPWKFIINDKNQADTIAKEINEDILKFVREMSDYIKELDRESHKYDLNYKG